MTEQLNWTAIARCLKYVIWEDWILNYSVLYDPNQRYLNVHCKDWSWSSKLWPCDVKSGLIGKDHDAGKEWRQGEKGMTEDKMVGQHHRLNGHEFEQALRVSHGQRNLVCCNPWGHKKSEATEWLNKNKSERQRDGGLGGGQEREEPGRKCTKMLKIVPSGFWDYGWFLSFN